LSLRLFFSSVPRELNILATGIGRGKMQLAAFDGPSPKNSYKRKNLGKISYASRVIVDFVPNFVAMAKGVNRGEIQMSPLIRPSPKTIY